VQYRVVGTSGWTTGSTTSTSYTATPLNALSNYEWQAQTVCQGGSSSFTALSAFSTPGNCGTPGNLSVTQITSTTATLNWGAVSGAQSYNLQWRSSSSSTWTSVTNLVSTSYPLSNLTSCSSYQFQVQAVCSAGAGAFSSISSFSTAGCTITYCTSRGNNTSYEYINRVVLGTINNTSGNNGGYYNYTALSTNLSGNTSYTISLTPGFTSSSYNEYWTVYIDYNHNGSFSDAGERIVSGNSSSTLSLAFTVPSSALNGATRMRIQMRYSSAASGSCSTYTYGEVEDYTVVITSNAQMTQLNSTSIPDEAITERSTLTLFPNPAGNKLNITFESRGGSSSLLIFSLDGKLIQSEKLEVREGVNSTDLNTSQLPDGIYFMYLVCGSESEKTRFIIAH
jgi:hypothetical protein